MLKVIAFCLSALELLVFVQNISKNPSNGHGGARTHQNLDCKQTKLKFRAY